MSKRLPQLLMVFALGIALGVLLDRWLKPDRPPLSGAAAPATAATAGPHAPHVLPDTRAASSAGNSVTVATGEPADPAAWLKNWAASGAPVEQRDEAMRMVELWTATDARAALEFVAGTARFPGRIAAFIVPLARLGEQDMAFAANWMRARLTLDEREEIAGDVAARIGEKNPALALELAFAPDLPVDRGTLGRLIAALVRTQPAQALGYFEQLSEEGRRETADSLAAAFFAADREAALKWCEAQRGSVHGRAAVAGLLEAVAKTAPEQLSTIISRLAVAPEDIAELRGALRTSDAALALLPHLPDSGRRPAVTSIVADEMQRDPALALKLAREALSPEVSNEVIQEAWETWRHSDAKAALEWARGVDDPVLKLALLGELEDPVLKMDPARFLAETERAGPGSKTPGQITRAIRDVANLAPADAAAWIDRMPGIVPPEVAREVAAGWLERDEQAAWGWINSLPASPLRDAAFSGAILHWVGREQLPQATAALAAVSDSRTQTALRWGMLQRLHMHDPENARRWLAAQPMNNEVRESWLTILETDP